MAATIIVNKAYSSDNPALNGVSVPYSGYVSVNSIGFKNPLLKWPGASAIAYAEPGYSASNYTYSGHNDTANVGAYAIKRPNAGDATSYSMLSPIRFTVGGNAPGANGSPSVSVSNFRVWVSASDPSSGAFPYQYSAGYNSTTYSSSNVSCEVYAAVFTGTSMPEAAWTAPYTAADYATKGFVNQARPMHLPAAKGGYPSFSSALAIPGQVVANAVFSGDYNGARSGATAWLCLWTATYSSAKVGQTSVATSGNTVIMYSYDEI